jgi:hypothetical protein
MGPIRAFEDIRRTEFGDGVSFFFLSRFHGSEQVNVFVVNG